MNTFEVAFCLEALARCGPPSIFSSDQGSEFTSQDSTAVLEGAGARIDMDGLDRWMDNVFIERLWRSPKYEGVYLRAFEADSDLRAGLERSFGYYNGKRPHSYLDGHTHDDVYNARPVPAEAPWQAMKTMVA